VLSPLPPNPYSAPSIGKVDRKALLRRWSPRFAAATWDDVDARAPLQVGNGNFAFTADITGLQTNPALYAVRDDAGHAVGTLLGTMTSWGWHSVPFDHLPGVAPGTPEPSVEVALKDYETPLDFDKGTRTVPYVDLKQEQWGGVTGEPDIREEWLRNNPHRLDLGRFSFWLSGHDDDVVPIADATQTLDLQSGQLRSQFVADNSTFEVLTVAHPINDELLIQIKRLTGDTRFGIDIKFPYGSQEWGNSQDWNNPTKHTTEMRRYWGDMVADATQGLLYELQRTVDQTQYTVSVLVNDGTLLEIGAHHYRIVADDHVLTVKIAFNPGVTPDNKNFKNTPCDSVAIAATGWWDNFWESGAAISFDGTADPRAAELERRIVLSQYLIAINSAGNTPPAETGLMLNSWRGKFHLEMHYWHAANLPIWGHPELLARSLDWYASIRDAARATAQRQGYAGVRWPKQTDPSGTETPSSIGTFLIWQQPHPIYLAELLYRSGYPNWGRYSALVQETADFMASFVIKGEDGKYHLPPPLVPAQESYARNRSTTSDPTFELAYWAFALNTAANWVDRLYANRASYEPQFSETNAARWREVAANMRRPEPTPPSVANTEGAHVGTYPAIAVEPYTIRTDHPSMIAALGVVPAGELIDPEIMARTLADITDTDWEWESTWGWDYPMGAMTATRLGLPDQAIDWLMLNKGKNEFLANGHNYQTPALPIYLPGNGGLLAAIGLMAGGWDGGPDRPAPGFPPDWKVQAEGFIRNP